MRVIHIMSDGSTRDSVEGLTVSYEKNRALYSIIQNIHNGDLRYENKKNNTSCFNARNCG